MAGKNLALEELKKVREQLIQDLADVQYEEKIVVAAVMNPEQMGLISSLQNYTKIPKHSKELLKTQNEKNIPQGKINEKKLIHFYKTFIGVNINNISLKTLPLTDDPTDKCWYMYKVNANIVNLQFNITYCSNKPPDDTSPNNEIIKRLTITFLNSTFQREIQEGLDFFSQHSMYIPSAILFLKSVNNLNIIRKNICKELMMEYKKFLNIAVNETSGHLCIICKGVAHPANNFTVYWQIKWDPATYSGRDSFKVDTHFSEKLVVHMKPVFEQICRHSKWSKLTEKQKLTLFKNAVYFIVEADDRENTSDRNVSFTEYSSIS